MFSVYSFQKSKRRKITHCKLQLEEGRVANIYASLALEICIFFFRWQTPTLCMSTKPFKLKLLSTKNKNGPWWKSRAQPFLRKLEAVQLSACYEHKLLIQVPLLFKNK